MKILKLTLKYICGVESGIIYADGANVYITGPNGAGKTTFANAYSLLMTGKYFDGTTGEVNALDVNGNYIRDEKIHSVEVELDSGLTIRREFLNKFDKAGNFTGVTQKFFVDGVAKKQKEFDAKVYQLTQGASINPFGFCKMAWKERREILMTMIHVDDAEILKEFPELKLGRLDAQNFIDFCKSEMKTYSASAMMIPARIDELQKQIVDGNLEALQKKLLEKSEEVKKLQVGQVDNLRLSIQKAEFEISKQNEKIQQAQKNFAELGRKYQQVKKSSPGLCPYCGQKMPHEKFLKSKSVELEKLKSEGRQVKEAISQHKKFLVELSAELEKLKAELERAEKGEVDFSELEKTIQERDALQEQVTKLQVSEINKKRIEELKKAEREGNLKIAELQKKINLAEKFQRRKIQSVEDAVNAKFEVVKFKLFERLINGTIKEICEPMIDGVMFGNLSKGEQLKASLDILKALQKFFGIELPVWIDDAESYTSNSFVDLPNQTFQLKAVEGQELKIEVDVKARAVAA